MSPTRPYRVFFCPRCANSIIVPHWVGQYDPPMACRSGPHLIRLVAPAADRFAPAPGSCPDFILEGRK